MSQMLLPLSNLAAEIMNVWKGRIRAVAMVEGMVDDENFPADTLEPLTSNFSWAEVPYMRELLRVGVIWSSGNVLLNVVVLLLTSDISSSHRHINTEAQVYLKT